MRGEVTAGQTLDSKAEFSQSFLRQIDLAVFEGIFVAATYQERELITIRFKETAEVEPLSLGFVVHHEACCCGEVEEAMVTIQRIVQFA